MRFTLIIQNFAQLNEVYGEQNAETIKGNCGNLVYLLSTELKALEEISKMCGDVKAKTDDKEASKPLVTISDLQKLSQFEVITRRVRLAPFKTKLTPNYKMNWGKQYPVVSINDVPSREIQEVQTFNVKAFVEEKLKGNKDSILDLAKGGGELPFFGGMPGSNPFMGNMPSTNPFMNSGPSPTPAPVMNDFNDSFDVDDIVRKIDAKIAELEKEEAMNNQNRVDDNNMNNIINNQEAQKINNNNLEQIINNQQQSNISNNPVNTGNAISSQSNNINNSNVNNNTDDEFFDDFFE